LLLTAVILVAGGLATALAKTAGLNQPRTLTRMIVVIACAGYYAVQWLRRGQTLPMKTLADQPGNYRRRAHHAAAGPDAHDTGHHRLPGHGRDDSVVIHRPGSAIPS